MEDKVQDRVRRIRNVTLVGSVVNLVLTAGKLAAGLLGRSAAMVADAVHSLSDLATDIIVIVFARISSKGHDDSHDYGHGKFETLATLIVSLCLLVVGANIMVSGIESIKFVIEGGVLPKPDWIALAAAIISVLSKEWLYQYTVKEGRKLNSSMMIANAWHHRSDALSSIGAFIGIGFAILPGDKWTVLDPAVSCLISLAILYFAVKLALPSLNELLDVSLPKDVEDGIIAAAESVEGVRNVHNLRTRKSGPAMVVDAHVVVDPQLTVERAHEIVTDVERAIRVKFPDAEYVTLHIEPDEASE